MSKAAAKPTSSLDRLSAEKRLEMVMRTHERRAAVDAGFRGAPGFAVAVTQGDEVLLRSGVGMASIENGLPIGPGTAFRIASVSKQFTCAALLLLARRGEADLEADIRDVLPGVLPGLKTVPRGALSLRRLMHMSSGLRDFLAMFRSGGVELDQRLDEVQIAAMIDRHTALNFAPNTRFLYCNTNYRLLGQAIEKLTGLDLNVVLRTLIFDPLGMVSTRHTPDPDTIEPGLATGYLQRPGADGALDPRNGRWTRAVQRFPLGGEGGLVSTLDDLLVWAQALLSPPKGFEFLPAALRAAMPFEQGHDNLYARGQELLPYRGLGTVGHGGLWPGYRTEFLVVPQRRIAVIVIANDSGLSPHALSRRLLDALLWPELGPPEPGESAPEPGLYLDPAQGLALAIGGPSPALGNAPSVSLFGGTAPLRAEKDGWWAAEAGAVVLQVKALADGLSLADDSGRHSALKKIEREGELPRGLGGAWRCDELDCVWRIHSPQRIRGTAQATLDVQGPVLAQSPGWSVRPLADGWVEIVAASKWLPAGYTARLEGETLLVQAGRMRGLRFERLA